MSQETFLSSVLEEVTLVSSEYTDSGMYEDVIFSHTTALQHDSNVVHPKYRPPQPIPTSSPGYENHNSGMNEHITEANDSSRHYSDVLLLPLPSEATHISHTPTNRNTVETNDDAYYEVILNQRTPSVYQDTLDLGKLTEFSAYQETVDNSSRECRDFELPSFRPRGGSNDPSELALSVQKVRERKSLILDDDDIKVFRDPLPPPQTKSSNLYCDLRDFTSSSQITNCYPDFEKNPSNFLSPPESPISPYPHLTPSPGRTSTSAFPELNDDEAPIYSEPDKPKARKISREASTKLLESCNLGDFMIRKNKENVILSVKVHNKIKHIKIEIEKDYIKLGKESFSSLDEMIEFHKTSSPVSKVQGEIFLHREYLPSGLVKE